MKESTKWNILTTVFIVVIGVIGVILLTGCASSSLGDAPAREWTEADDLQCYRRGGLPVYNHNSERTMCSSDMIW